MPIIEFFGNFFVSILVGYLSFTNNLATRIEVYFPAPEPKIVLEAPRTIVENVPEPEPETQNISTFSGKIPRILLEHREFQKAALIASGRTETTDSTSSDIPLTEVVTDALVNIYCQYKTDKYIRTTTGTGFFIHQKGVILTNAHVAQFLLLRDAEDTVQDVDCVIRGGNPAQPLYNAELLYISPTWVFENADLITDEMPRGTGERDYALLYVSKTVDASPLPAKFPIIPIDTALLARSTTGMQVVTAGYPAESLMRDGANAKLFPVTASTTVGTLYTFGSNYADIFAISESPVGEQGASGGPIVDAKARGVIGIIVTKGDQETEGVHSLRAITMSYIDRTMIEETGFSLAQNMLGDVALRGNIFKQAMVPFLAGLLEENLRSE